MRFSYKLTSRIDIIGLRYYINYPEPPAEYKIPTTQLITYVSKMVKI
jgi:hypothetical protein